jgi:glycine cleavage system regulatory protein
MHLDYVITLYGTDQPGIIDQLAGTLAEAGASWQESSMSHLAGRFAGIIRATVDAEASGLLEENLAKLSHDALVLRFELASKAVVPARDGVELFLDLVGHDRPGILSEISSALASRGVNIAKLSTRCDSAPMSGERLFHASAALMSPVALPLEELSEALETIGQDLMVDIRLEAGPS